MSKKPVKPEDYLELKKIGEITATSDLVAWTELSPDPVKRTHSSVVRLLRKKNGEQRVFTQGTDSQLSFSPDGRYLSFISRRSGKQQVMIMDLEFGGEAKAVTRAKNGVTSFSWSPDSKKIAFTARYNEEELKNIGKKEKFITEYEVNTAKAEEEEKERRRTDPRVIDTIVYREGTSYHDGRKSILFVTMIGDEKETKQISSVFTNYSKPQWISDTEFLTTAKLDEPVDLNMDVTILRFSSEEEKQEGTVITKIRSFGLGGVRVSPSMKYFAYHSLDDEDIAGQLARLKVYDIQTGIVKDVNSRIDRGITHFEWTEQNNLICVVEDEGIADIRKYSVTDDQLTTVFRGKNSVGMVAPSGNDVYYIATGPLHPSTVWKNEEELVYEPNEEYLSSHNIIEPEEMWFDSPDGFKFQGWFFEAKKGEKTPLALHIHGGPHVMWNNAGTMWHEWQCFLSAGYSVLATNPQGSSGYGESITKRIVGNWGVDDSRDLMLAVDAVLDRVDKDHLYVLGGSYAGFQTANIITRDHRFRAAVAQRGVFDLVTFSLNTDIPIWGMAEFKGGPWENLEHLWKLSPVGRVKEIQTPLLIIAGENDFRVAISQSEELFGAMKLQNKEVVFVRYPRDGHELSRSGEPLHIIDRIERMIRWFEDHK